MATKQQKKTILCLRHPFATACPELEPYLSKAFKIDIKDQCDNPKAVLYCIFPPGCRMTDNIETEVKTLEEKYKTKVYVIVLRLGDNEHIQSVPIPYALVNCTVQIAFAGSGIVKDLPMTLDAMKKLRLWL